MFASLHCAYSLYSGLRQIEKFGLFHFGLNIFLPFPIYILFDNWAKFVCRLYDLSALLQYTFSQ